MTNLSELKVTTDILWKGALLFAMMDVLFVVILMSGIKPDDFRKMKRSLLSGMGIFFFLLFGILLSIVFWDSVYSYVFPVWARWIIPPCYAVLFVAYGLFAWWLSLRLPTNTVLNFCILGGLWGILTHVLAIYRGILDKPPMLHDADPLAALVLAAFEFVFYWCVCLGLTLVFRKIKNGSNAFSI
jgi:hypothetical protein